MIILESNYFELNKKWLQMKIFSQEALISDENIGPVLGQYGLNSQKFCLDFNERSFFVKKGVLINVYLFFFVDHLHKHIHFTIGYPWANFLIYHAVNSQFGFMFDELIELKELEIFDLDLLKLYKGFEILGWNDELFHSYFYKLHDHLYSIPHF